MLTRNLSFDKGDTSTALKSTTNDTSIEFLKNFNVLKTSQVKASCMETSRIKNFKKFPFTKSKKLLSQKSLKS